MGLGVESLRDVGGVGRVVGVKAMANFCIFHLSYNLEGNLAIARVAKVRKVGSRSPTGPRV